ncbi:putative Type IV pilus minor pilin PilW [Candidatus Sulfobium mesophilum]|uniref:Putative Type IV pilus minor pilin PilW n=1 Tax=Candidatus Sulfobium mesophilum TaxID=2016548 RepID=A0A2U3QGM8_9BACT|nr:putative Type IV pilus minor pilin PilW [Candidatus Sulfobium mesophilum]
MLIRNDRGFTLVELMITVVVFVLVIIAASQVFTALLTQFKQQSKIAESNIEGVVGLEIMRRDLDHAGFGLPWDLNGAAYTEAVADTATAADDTTFNDGPPGNPSRGSDAAGNSNVPGAIRSGNDLGWIGGGAKNSDVLVIKATNIALSAASQGWTYISNIGALNVIKSAGSQDNPPQDTPVIVVQPSRGSQRRVLVNGGNFWTLFKNNLADFDDAFEPGPQFSMQYHVAYGISDIGTTPRMPFNRADYYIKRPIAGMPGRCAPNTGILYKGVIVNNDASTDKGKHSELPLLDCVADMQVDYWLDTDNDGTVNPPAVESIANLTAQDMRSQLREIRIYIIAQEGQRDANFDCTNGGTSPHCASTVVELYPDGSSQTLDTVSGLSGPFFANLADVVNTPTSDEYKHYRWKRYTIVVQPGNLR